MNAGHADLIVLGAGPAGIGAAYRTARAGHRVVVLERGQGPGGAAASFELEGIRVDHGSHRLHQAIDPRILHDLHGLLGDELQRRPRNGRIFLEGRWIRFPLRPADLLRRLPPSFAAAAARDAATSWARRPRADSFAESLRAGLGPTMCRRFYFPYARKLWGLDPHELAGEQARRRVTASSPGRLLARVARGGGPPREFLYPRGGFGTISERLAGAAAAAGAELRYGSAARRVELAPEGATVTLAGGNTLSAGRVWSTIPLPALARMSDPAPPAAVAEATGQLAFRAMLLVYLVLDTGRYSPFDAHYLPDPGTPVTRVSEPTNYRDSGDDPPDRTVLCAELPCQQGDQLWEAADDRLAELVGTTLRDRGLPAPSPVRTVAVRRLPNAYPIYRVGYAAPFQALDAWAAAQPALLSFGRLGLFAHDNTHHALAMAWAAADALAPDGSFDHATWSAARDRFTSHVVED